MIKIKETKIQNVSKNKFEEIKLTFLIKKEDYTSKMEKEFFQLSRDGNLGVLVFQQTQIIEGKSKSQLLQDLGFLMSKYCEKTGTSIELEVSSLYQEYKITSRTQLTEQQLEYEINKYKNGFN